METCLENLRAAALVLTAPPFGDDGHDAVDEARDLLNRIHKELLDYDDELKAA
ncbi:UNVERIFIED_ORG: hypothetical protein ABIB52_004504 [Arthrobacter sp. UYCu721]